jgi:hypothetical protein
MIIMRRTRNIILWLSTSVLIVSRHPVVLVDAFNKHPITLGGFDIDPIMWTMDCAYNNNNDNNDNI